MTMLKVRSFAFFGSFATSTLPLKFPNTTGAPEKEIFSVLRPEKDRTDPEILCSHTLIVMGNFNSNVLAQKKGQKAKKPDFQTLAIINKRMYYWIVSIHVKYKYQKSNIQCHYKLSVSLHWACTTIFRIKHLLKSNWYDVHLSNVGGCHGPWQVLHSQFG